MLPLLRRHRPARLLLGLFLGRVVRRLRLRTMESARTAVGPIAASWASAKRPGATRPPSSPRTPTARQCSGRLGPLSGRWRAALTPSCRSCRRGSPRIWAQRSSAWRRPSPRGFRMWSVARCRQRGRWKAWAPGRSWRRGGWTAPPRARACACAGTRAGGPGDLDHCAKRWTACAGATACGGGSRFLGSTARPCRCVRTPADRRSRAG